jgi:hypothetical protein
MSCSQNALSSRYSELLAKRSEKLLQIVQSIENNVARQENILENHVKENGVT